jgi:large subunit ribosomal protein L23
MNTERLMKILLRPHVSEKTAMAADSNRQFAFRVLENASKPEIKHAVELMFDVQVDDVRVLNVKGKAKRSGATMGRRINWKKAYVSLKPGFDIDFTGSN